MRIPHTINANYFKTYTPAAQTHELPSEKHRIFRAEDASWDQHFIPPLTELCVVVLVETFERRPVINELPCNDRNLLLETLPTNLPLRMVIRLMNDGIYWKRMVEARWQDKPNHIDDHGFSWKQLYMERHVQEAVEALSPEGFELQSVQEMCNMASKYIYKLDIRQLQIATLKIHDEDELIFDEDDEDECNIEPDNVDHIDLSPIILGLKNLVELHIKFGILNVGSNYKKIMFHFSARDARNIGRGINVAENLKLFRIHNSHLDDDKCIAMLSQMTENKSLETLEITSCIIGDNGAAAVAKLVKEHSRISTLNLSNNKIMEKGVSALAFVINQDQCAPLTSLNLKMNNFGDDGGKYMASVLLRGVTKIADLNMSCCGLGEETAVLIAEMLNHNKTLTGLNLSNNYLGQYGGQILQNGVINNNKIQYLDLRMTGVANESLKEINRQLHLNRVRERKGEKFVDIEIRRLADAELEEQMRLEREAEEALADEMAAEEAILEAEEAAKKKEEEVDDD